MGGDVLADSRKDMDRANLERDFNARFVRSQARAVLIHLVTAIESPLYLLIQSTRGQPL